VTAGIVSIGGKLSMNELAYVFVVPCVFERVRPPRSRRMSGNEGVCGVVGAEEELSPGLVDEWGGSKWLLEF